MKNIIEPLKKLEVMTSADVVVCGGGPAGIAASIASARQGANTILLEAAGNLGGIWTSGLLPHILGYCEQSGLILEIKDAFQKIIDANSEVPKTLPSPEAVKLAVERMCLDAGVNIFLHTKACGVKKEENGITHVIIETLNGRQAIEGKMFIDCTGNGDLGACADCGFDMGRKEDGVVQPLSLVGLVTGVSYSDVKEYVSGSSESYQKLYDKLIRCGMNPSYSRPGMTRVSNDVFIFTGNQQYNVPCTNTKEMTMAILEARAELHAQINALRSLGGHWKNLKLIATGSQIGIREGRRLHGLYTLTLDDLKKGRTFSDAVCKVRFSVDVHALSKDSNRSITSIGRENPVKPYDIPLRALISRDCKNLLMAGRCISGDFYAHASYRVTGIAVPCGEAVGICAANVIRLNTFPEDFVKSKFLNMT